MTGFKDGASSDDPFADDPVDDSDDEEDTGASLEPDPTPVTDVDQGAGEDDRDRRGSGGLPWIYQRSSITDGRTTVQLHLQDDSEDLERQAKSDVEALLGESVKKADLREAALLVGYQRLEETADQLREWGYDIE